MSEFNPDKHCGAQRANQPPGTLCTRNKGWGTSHPGVGHCKRHGGSTPSQTKAAEREIAEQAVVKLMLVDPSDMQDIDARDVLAEELWRSRAAVIVLGQLVNDLGLDEGGLYARTYHVSGLETGEAKPHVLWVMLMEERKHLRSVAVEAAKAGVEARRIELAEAQANAVAMLLRAVFADPELALDQARQHVAAQVAARHLRALPPG